MALLLLLLLLTLRPSLRPAQELSPRSVVSDNFDMAKVSGVWYSSSMASDDMRRIEEDGDLRVFISSIESLDNGNLQFQFYLPLQGQCERVAIVCEKTERSGEYTLSYKGDNKVLLSETDYDLYVTFLLHNVSNGTETRVLALYGRVPELSSSFQERFLKICKQYGLGPENIINLSNQDACFAGRR